MEEAKTSDLVKLIQDECIGSFSMSNAHGGFGGKNPRNYVYVQYVVPDTNFGRLKSYLLPPPLGRWVRDPNNFRVRHNVGGAGSNFFIFHYPVHQERFERNIVKLQGLGKYPLEESRDFLDEFKKRFTRAAAIFFDTGLEFGMLVGDSTVTQRVMDQLKQSSSGFIAQLLEELWDHGGHRVAGTYTSWNPKVHLYDLQQKPKEVHR